MYWPVTCSSQEQLNAASYTFIDLLLSVESFFYHLTITVQVIVQYKPKHSHKSLRIKRKKLALFSYLLDLCNKRIQECCVSGRSQISVKVEWVWDTNVSLPAEQEWKQTAGCIPSLFSHYNHISHSDKVISVVIFALAKSPRVQPNHLLCSRVGVQLLGWYSKILAHFICLRYSMCFMFCTTDAATYITSGVTLAVCVCDTPSND